MLIEVTKVETCGRCKDHLGWEDGYIYKMACISCGGKGYIKDLEQIADVLTREELSTYLTPEQQSEFVKILRIAFEGGYK